MNQPTRISLPSVELSFRDEVVPADLEHVRGIVASTEMFTAAEVDVAVELVDERLHKEDASGYWFVFAEREGVPLGYACYGPIAGTQSSFDLFWIAVEQSSRGLGIGRVLMDASETRARAMGCTRLYVETSDRAAYLSTRVFYERLGYRREATLEDFYAPGDHKVIYVKVL